MLSVVLVLPVVLSSPVVISSPVVGVGLVVVPGSVVADVHHGVVVLDSIVVDAGAVKPLVISNVVSPSLGVHPTPTTTPSTPTTKFRCDIVMLSPPCMTGAARGCRTKIFAPGRAHLHAHMHARIRDRAAACKSPPAAGVPSPPWKKG